MKNQQQDKFKQQIQYVTNHMKDNFVIESVTDCVQINKSPINDSTAKHLWSFPKNKRFNQEKSYCDSFYNIPDFINKKKGAAQGYGVKYDFTQDLTCSPPVTKYQNPTIFDINKIKRKGYSLAIGRNQTTPRGHIDLDPLKVPGPGTYAQMKQRGLSFTMRPKTKVIDIVQSIEPQNGNPGPGNYTNPEATSSNGRYFITKFRNSGARLFNPRRSQRFSKMKNNIPGPGNYVNSENDLSSKGRYPLSKNQGTGTRAFGHDRRSSFVDQFAKIHQNPGPGSYRSPSDFGQYDKKVQ